MQKTDRRDQILKNTTGGRQIFQLLVPGLEMEGDRNTTNVDSPISKGKKCFSVWEWNEGRYYFKDWYTSKKGDVFEFVALLNNLNPKTDFVKILDIIDELLKNNNALIHEAKKMHYENMEDGSYLTLIDEDISSEIIDKNFFRLMPFLEQKPSYKIQVVDEFEIYVVTDRERDIHYKLDYSKPDDTFYSFTIKECECYVLFNPNRKMQSYIFGRLPEFYVLGMERLFNMAFNENVYLRNNIVITNKFEGLLFLQDKGIPCLAVINNEMELPKYIIEVVLAMFPKKLLLMHKLGPGKKQADSFSNQYEFEQITYWDSYLFTFLKNKEATDKVIDCLDQCEDFEYEGFASQVMLMSPEVY